MAYPWATHLPADTSNRSTGRFWASAEKGIMASAARYKRKRELLWQNCNGLCHWCKCATVLPVGYTARPAPNMATLDHLTDRAGLPGRAGRVLTGIVLACYGCNQKRARTTQRRIEQYGRPEVQ